MTAEIAIMNKIAVALAADSAGTIGSKIYNSENKLFMLSKHYPVGIMVYDLLSFMGVPWEYIIKTYRNELDKRSFGTLQGYADNFIENLLDIIPINLQKAYFKDFTKNHFEEIRIIIDQYLNQMNATDVQLSNILKSNCEGISNTCVINSLDLNKKIQISIVLDGYKIITKNNVDHKWAIIPEEFIKDVENDEDYQRIITELIYEIFGDLIIMGDFTEQLKDIAILKFYEIHLTGVVIAGFGEDEKFPSVISTNIGPQINGNLEAKPNKKETCKIEHFKGARIIPFAQHEMVDAFLDGVTPKYHEEAKKCLKGLVKNNSEKILQIIDDTKAAFGEESVSEEFLISLKEKITDVQDGSHEIKFNQEMEKVKKEHKNPILAAINVLPKDELALMAESLVDITSLKRKASINELETVGGAIDVAVISKNDGFIWIKRKHYFDPNLNHHFFKRYYDTLSDQKIETHNNNEKDK